MTAVLGQPISRRTVLRGLGAAIALPWLEAMAPRSILAASDPGPLPIRLGFIYIPNGADMENWTPTVEGTTFDLPSVLQPLAAMRDDVLVLSGLASDKARPHGDGGNHAPALAAFLTGAHPRKSEGAALYNGVSADQLAAMQLGRFTRLPSLELGCGQANSPCDKGFSCVYTSTMSWRSPTQPMPKESSPRVVFDRLFGAPSGADTSRRTAARRSILDAVGDEAASLGNRLGGTDRRKLDEYLAAVRDIEQRIDRAETLPVPRVPDGIARPAAGVPESYEEQLRLLGDLMVVAFQTDVTRVSTFLFDHEGSNRSYREIGVSGGHHSLSHHRNLPETKAQIAAINRFHMTRFAAVLGQLRAIREGDGTLLDRCLIAYGSTIADGNTHDHHDLPILLAGKGGGSVRSGRHVRYPTETPLTNLWLSMLDRAGMKTASLGDSTGRLKGLDG
jgi:hypothetical protein